MRATALILALAASAAAAAAPAGVVVKTADRDIIIHMQVVDTRTRYTFLNEGADPVAAVTVCEEPELSAKVAFFEVLPASEDGGTLPASSIPTPPGAPNGTACVSVSLPTPLAPGGGEAGVDAFASHVRAQAPRPATVAKGDPQRVRLAYSHVIASPYAVREQTTKIILPDERVEGHSTKPPTSLAGTTLTHGPYPATPAWAHSPAFAHYVNNAPFAHAVVTREVEVSHWGNVAIEETYDLEHAGARATGEWSRHDFDVLGRAAWPASLPGFRAALPPPARWLYFKDEIGNVSTSNVRYGAKKVEAILRPRYPLMGGWRARFVFGHSLPLQSVAERTKDGRVRVSIPFGPSVEDVVADALSTTVVLPEGARDIRHALPFPAAVARGVKKTYLDTAGRPTLTLTVRNAVAEHAVPLVVSYALPAWRPWVEPLMVVAAVAAVFGAALAASRVDASLTADAGGGDGGKPVAALAARLAAVLADRAAHVDAVASRATPAAARTAAEAALAASGERLRALVAELEGAAGGARGAAVKRVAAAQLALAAAATAVAGAGEGAVEAAAAKLAAAKAAAAKAADEVAAAFR